MSFTRMTLRDRFNERGEKMDPTEVRIKLAAREIALLNEDLRNAWDKIDRLREEIAAMKMKEAADNGDGN